MKSTGVTRSSAIGHQFAWVSAGRRGAALLQAMLFALFARTTSPQVFGIVAGVLGVFLIAQAITDMGVTSHMTSSRASNSAASEVPTALIFNAWSSVAMTLVLILFGWILHTVTDVGFMPLTLLAFSTGFDRYASLLVTVALADGNPRLFVGNTNLRRVITLMAMIALLLLNMDGLNAFSIATVIGSIVGAVGAYLTTRRYISYRGRTRLRNLLRGSWPYWLNSIGMQLRNADVLVVAIIAGPLSSGLFASASRLTSPFRIIPTALATVLLPNVSRLRANNESLRPALRASVLVIAVSTVVYGVGALLVPLVLVPVLGHEYAGSELPIQLVLLGMPFAAVASLSGSVLQALGRARLVGYIAIGFSVGCLVIVGLGGLIDGAVGAAVGLSASFVVQSALLVAWLPSSRKRLRRERQNAIQ